MMEDAKLKRIERLLWEEWDPIGLNDNPEWCDEYDTYALKVWGMVRRGDSQGQIADYLTSVEIEQIELTADPDRNLIVAGKALKV